MKRFVSVAFSFLIFIFIFLPNSVSAAGFVNTPTIELSDMSAVSQWSAYFQDVINGNSFVSDITNDIFWAAMDGAMSKVVPGEKANERELARVSTGFHGFLLNCLSDFVDYQTLGIIQDRFKIIPKIGYDSQLDVFRLYDSVSGIPLVNSYGYFPYYYPTTATNPDTGETSVSLGGQWIQYSKVNWNRVNILTEYSLYDIGYALRDIGQDNDVKAYFSGGSPKYQYIASRWTAGAVGEHYVYCDENGQPYVYRPAADEWAQEDDNNYYVDDDGDNIFDDGDTVNDKLIDLDSNTVWFPNGTLQYINNLVYDESTKTYYVDAHQEYDIDNNTYVTNNYHYEYHINYTSVTYIGQTEEYDEKYEFYYQLPDGRNSADLTADELQALNTQIDVLSYVRSADDTSIRALYHFDGNTRDSSYWSHIGNFKWNAGATLTYMDVGEFNGALYLDENAHDFTVTLPKNLGTGDFTIQFRYYQSHTEAPQSDSYIQINDWRPMVFTGANFTSNKGSVFAATPVGQWNEICIQRSSGTTYWFVNGVCVNTGTGQSGTAFGNQIQFVFGSEQQTYKYFDELRVVTKALYPSSGYTPSAVPFDTNLTLVLPDSKVPVADAYWSFSSSGENLLTPYGLDSWMDFGGSDYVKTLSNTPSYSTGDSGWKSLPSYKSYVFPSFSYGTRLTSLRSEGALSISSTGFTSGSYTLPNIHVPDLSNSHSGFGSTVDAKRARVPTYGLISCLRQYNGSWQGLGTGTYTFSLVNSSGEVGSVSFSLSSSVSISSGNSYRVTSANFDGYTFGLLRSWEYYNSSVYPIYYLFITPTTVGSTGGEIIYMELVKSSSTDLSAEYIESVVVMDKDDLNTPSLAVRTDLDITGYQIGGVRPSLPTKGLVWALVEAGRISSLQIYDGQAWESVDGRIWTGSRWVPYYAYDVLLLKDLWDIVEGDPTLDFIYTEEGFWKWLQDAWGQMMGKLDQIIAALGGTVKDPASECPHTYSSKVAREPTCTEPGHMTHSCDLCGHTYTELIDATGHDWVVTNTVPDVLDEDGSVIEEGYEELTCSKCDTISRDYGDGPEEVDLFDALGDFIADGISWILDKLTELADSLKGITETFNGFVEKVKGLAGGFPAFFGAFMALIPEDISTILWFAVIGFVVLAVWKKWSN